MVPFSIAIESKDEAVSLLAEQLDSLADEEGFIRFDIRDETRRAVVFVCVEQEPAAFSFDDTLTKEEVACIGEAIREHLSAGHFSSSQTLLL